RQARVAQQFCDWEVTPPVAELLDIERLQMDGLEIWPRWDAPLCERRHDGSPVQFDVQPYDVHEPRHKRGGRCKRGSLQALLSDEAFGVPACHARPLCQELVDTAQLGNTEGRTQLIEPVVVPEPGVREPRVE